MFVSLVLLALSAEPVECIFSPRVVSPRGCVPVSIMERALATGCVPSRGCISLPVVETPQPVIRISVFGKGASSAKAMSLCKVAALQLGYGSAKCVVGEVKPSNVPLEARLDLLDAGE